MDARAMLDAVSEAYRNLKSFEASALAITENREDGFSRSEQPVKFSYVAPNRLRIEQGKRGMLVVCDGQALHVLFAGPNRYSKAPVPTAHPLPGIFNPQLPYVSNNNTLLFPNVGERVTAAEILRHESIAVEGLEAACDVVSATYEPLNRGPITHTTPFLFWVDSETRLILRTEFEMTMQFPRHGERTTKHTLAVTRLAMNEAIDPSVFVFVPPINAEEMPTGVVGGFGGGGSQTTMGEGKQRIRQWTSNEWQSDTLIQRSKLTLFGQELSMERRWTMSEDKSGLRVLEKIEGPKGPIEREFTIPLG